MSTPHGPDAPGQLGEQENLVPQQPQETSAPHADVSQFVPSGDTNLKGNTCRGNRTH